MEKIVAGIRALVGNGERKVREKKKEREKERKEGTTSGRTQSACTTEFEARLLPSVRVSTSIVSYSETTLVSVS